MRGRAKQRKMRATLGRKYYMRQRWVLRIEAVKLWVIGP